MSTAARKRSTRSSKDEETFVVDDEEAPSLGNEKIGRHEEWSSVRETLYKAGWKWKKGPGLISYVYLKPHIDSIKDRRRHIDYFIDESHLKEYVAVKYKWKGEKEDPTSKPVRSSTRSTVQRKKVTLARNQGTSTTKKSSTRLTSAETTQTNQSSIIKRKRTSEKLDDDDSYRESDTSIQSEKDIENKNNNKKLKKNNKDKLNININKNNKNKKNYDNNNNNKNKNKTGETIKTNTRKNKNIKIDKNNRNGNNKTINNKNNNINEKSNNGNLTDNDDQSVSSSESSQKSRNKISVKSKKKITGKRNESDGVVTVVKGSKTKPGLISFAEDNDHRIGRKVAFLIDSKEGRSLMNYFDECIPAEAIQTYIQKSDPIKFLVGVVNKRSKRKNCYTVAWEWSCATLHEVDFEVTIIDRAISQFINISKNMRYSTLPSWNFEENCSTLDDRNSKQYSKECNNLHAEVNEFDVISSEDDYSDDDGFELDNLHINHNVNDDTNFGKCYSTIRHSRNLDSDLKMAFLTERGGVSSSIEKTNGLKWEMNGKLQAPSGLGVRTKTKIKGNISCFSTELESLLAFLPLTYWVHHLHECNKYVAEYFNERERYYCSDEIEMMRSSRKFQGMKWKPIKIDELMVFYAIIIQMACRPFPGKKFEECWNYTKDWFTNCEHMKKTRFKQIRAALHWSDNPHSHSKKDTLYKVRPIINVLEKTIGRYLEVGQEVALDETTIGLYHAYAKALTYYNPSKPRGKHHCKLFVLCENDYWSAINFHFAHRSYEKKKSQWKIWKKERREKEKKKKAKKPYESPIGYDVWRNSSDSDDSSANIVFSEDKIDETEAETKEVPKMVQLVTSMCECLKGTGIVVNMDNLYSSPEVFIALKKMGIYARGTFRSNRKYLPSFVKFTKSETLKLPRGCFRLATNEEHNLSCYAWNDKNPVHILSSADGTDVQTTQRRSKAEKIKVLCPSAVKRYNQGMQAVDQFNKLLTLFSLASLKFNKYYKKIAMVLLDFAITNAYLHHKIANNTKDNRQYSRVKFMENLQEQLIEVDWAEKIRRHQMNDSDNESLYSNDDMHFRGRDEEFYQDVIENGLEMVRKRRSVKKLCNPVAMQPSCSGWYECYSVSENMRNMELKALSDSQRVCQICEFEGRGRRRTGVNYCPHHKIRACTLKNPHPENLNKFRLGGVIFDIDFSESSNSWLCPDGSLTCWEKAHNWYIPNGLFHLKNDNRNQNDEKIDFTDVSKINWSSKLAKQRKKQLKNSLYSRKEGSVKGGKSPSIAEQSGKLDTMSIDEDSQARTQQKMNSILEKPVVVPRIDEIIDSQSHPNEYLNNGDQCKDGRLHENNDEDVASEKTREYEIDENAESQSHQKEYSNDDVDNNESKNLDLNADTLEKFADAVEIGDENEDKSDQQNYKISMNKRDELMVKSEDEV